MFVFNAFSILFLSILLCVFVFLCHYLYYLHDLCLFCILYHFVAVLPTDRSDFHVHCELQPDQVLMAYNGHVNSLCLGVAAANTDTEMKAFDCALVTTLETFEDPGNLCHYYR